MYLAESKSSRPYAIAKIMCLDIFNNYLDHLC
jgi:hypothetical protein